MPLDGGITNRNYRARFGGARLRDPRPGQGHRAARDRPRRRAGRQRARGRGRGRARRCAAMLDDPPCIVTEFVEGARDDRGASCASRDAAGAVARALRAIHEHRRAAADRASTPSGSSRPTPRPRASAAPTLPDGLRRGARRRRREIEAALRGPEHEPGALPQRPAGGATSSPAPSGCWIVDWEYAGMGDRYFDLANFAVNNELDEADEEALLGDYFGEPPDAAQARGAAADAVHVRLPRGDVGRRAGASSPSSTSTSTATPTSTSTA